MKDCTNPSLEANTQRAEQLRLLTGVEKLEDRPIREFVVNKRFFAFQRRNAEKTKENSIDKIEQFTRSTSFLLSCQEVLSEQEMMDVNLHNSCDAEGEWEDTKDLELRRLDEAQHVPAFNGVPIHDKNT